MHNTINNYGLLVSAYIQTIIRPRHCLELTKRSHTIYYMLTWDRDVVFFVQSRTNY